MEFFKRLRVPTPRSLWRVFGRDLWFVWTTLALVGGPLLWAFFNDRRDTDRALGAAGFLLVMAALVLIAVRLYSLRKRFEESWTPASPVMGWVRKAISLVWTGPPQTIEARTGRATIKLDPATLSASGTSAGTVEERIAALERRTSEAEKEIANARGEARQAIAELERKLRAEMAGVQQDAARTHKLLKDISLPGLKAEAVGLFWLILGTTLSTFPVGIAKLLQRFM